MSDESKTVSISVGMTGRPDVTFVYTAYYDDYTVELLPILEKTQKQFAKRHDQPTIDGEC